ncbi:MAG TPA: aspartate--tRNA ligase, partial [Pirellulales bacterium]|nr:aspartate--tRNA ligase [Pirellulales bacterium]
MIRSHTCGELRSEDAGGQATLCGWVDSYRDHGGGLLFVDLRDRYGKTQVVFNPESGPRVQELAKTLRSEFVIAVRGTVARRPEGTANRELPTGEIELRANHLEVLNACATPPFQPGAMELPGEDLRLKYRYLDLRRPDMQRTLVLRHRMIKAMRDYFDEHDFLEVETPMLGRSTPEGARDYLVPSRVHPGSFYALPQSPQLYKQILMVAGYDRYVQVARCFRDEDLRADRQPEFTQLDLEMSFVNADDVMGIIDGLVARLAKQVLGLEVALPLPRMTYDEAMERYGHDAPDLRFGMELIDVTDLAREAEFRVFREAAEGGLRVRGINARQAAARYSRKGIDELTELVKQSFGAKGLVWFKVEEGRTLASPTAKNFAPPLLARIAGRMEAEPGDLLLFVADSFEVTCKALYALRKRFGEELKLYPPGTMNCSWVVEFPMFAWDAEENVWAAMHHPFTAPRPQDLAMLASEPGKCRAQAYDLVINGSEAGGGTIRIHDNQVQQQVFSLLG